MPRGKAQEELHRLRRLGLDQATVDRCPELGGLLLAAGFGDQISTALETFFRALYRRYSENPNARILLELFMLTSETAGTSPRAALTSSVRRVRHNATPADKDAFRHNEMEKALRFAIDVLIRGDVRPDVDSSPALSDQADYHSDAAGEWHIRYHPIAYVGLIWLALQSAPTNAGTDHHVTVIWGDYLYERIFTLSASPFYLVHHKLEKDALPLYVHVTPPAVVAIGQGQAPEGESVNIDEGWLRLGGAPVRR